MDHRSSGVPYLKPYVMLSAVPFYRLKMEAWGPSGLARGPPVVKCGKQFVLLVILCQGCNQEKGGALGDCLLLASREHPGNHSRNLREKLVFHSDLEGWSYCFPGNPQAVGDALCLCLSPVHSVCGGSGVRVLHPVSLSLSGFIAQEVIIVLIRLL